MKRTSYLLMIFLCLIFSCKKHIAIKGYTSVDALGNLTGTLDNSDWTLDASWKSKETKIFDNIISTNLSGTTAGTITMYPAHPNPCANTFYLRVSSTTSCKMRFAIADKNIKTLMSDAVSVMPGNNTYGFSLNESFQPDKMYRFYYVFDAENNLMFAKGHGDLLVQ